MKAFGRVLLVLILIGWVPATNMCVLASVYPQVFSDCCSTGTSDSDDDCCSSCMALENGLVPWTSHSLVQVVLVRASDLSANKPIALLVDNKQSCSEFFSSPPELLKTWQFSFRAALAPRAPSLVS